MVAQIPALCNPIASMSRRFAVIEKNPLRIPHQTVARPSAHSCGIMQSTANQTIPIRPANTPRDRRRRANSLKIKSFPALQIRQHTANTIPIILSFSLFFLHIRKIFYNICQLVLKSNFSAIKILNISQFILAIFPIAQYIIHRAPAPFGTGLQERRENGRLTRRISE